MPQLTLDTALAERQATLAEREAWVEDLNSIVQSCGSDIVAFRGRVVTLIQAAAARTSTGQ